MNGLYMYDMRIGRSKSIKPEASLNDPPYRFNWNSPIYISPHDPKTVYTGGNYLFKTTDAGQSWKIMSPDLSTNDPDKLKDSGGPITLDNTGAEIHCTIITISESLVKKGVIWCGTDDGNVQITKDNGGTWENVVKNIKMLPANTWCSRIEASHFDAGTAYAAFDGHRNDDYNTYVYKTTDYGKTWESIKGNLPFGWIHVIREDLKNKRLLFIGTEFGIYASLDSGKTWFSLKNNMPTAAVRDIAIHPRDNDLIIGTHGRGIWILDDISPLQEMTEEVLQSDFNLFSIRPATQYFPSTTKESFSKPDYSAKNPPYGMSITVYLKENTKEKPKIYIKNDAGEKIFEIRISIKKGIQRHTWNLQYVPKTKEGKKLKPGMSGFVGLPYASAGEYSVELIAGNNKILKTGIVCHDPRIQIDEKSKALQTEILVEVLLISKKMALSVTSVKNIRRQLEKLNKDFLKQEDIDETVQNTLKNFDKKFSKLEKDITPKGFGYRGSMEMALRGGSLSQMIMSLGMSIGEYPHAPTETELVQLDEFKKVVDLLVERLNKLIEYDLAGLNETLEKHEVKPLKMPKQIKF